MITNLKALHTIHNHTANRFREVVGLAAAAFRADIVAEQPRATGLHRKTGKLFDSTQTETKWGARSVSVSASNAVEYAPYMEFGTRPHRIVPKHPGGLLRFFWTKVGRWVALRKVNHPGNRTYNFLWRAVTVANERLGYSLLFAMREIAARF